MPKLASQVIVGWALLAGAPYAGRAEEGLNEERVDQRREPFEIASSNPLLASARSVAVIMPAAALSPSHPKGWEIKSAKLGEKLNLCPGARYSEQQAPGYCSGFLVGPQLLATAGHCVKSAADCGRIAIAFDFAKASPEDSAHFLASSQVFRCAALQAHTIDRTTGVDYALIKLNRPAGGDRLPLKLERHSRLRRGDAITMIGHPGGIPLKVTPGGLIRNHSHPSFLQGTIDSFSGNSGSPVFNARTSLVAGMLVRGENSYHKAPGSSCYKPLSCAGKEECRGEDFLRPEVFADHIPKGEPALVWTDLRLSEHQGDGNGYPDPGEELGISLLLQNKSPAPLTGLTLKLTSSSPHLRWLKDRGRIDHLSANASTATPLFIAAISKGAPCQEALPLKLSIGQAGREQIIRREFFLGEPLTTAFALDLHEVIADNTFPGHREELMLEQAPRGRKVEFLVDVSHPQAHQLKIDITAPDGSTSTLFFRGRTPQGGFLQDLPGGIHGVYGRSLLPYQNIETFRGVTTPGLWSFHIADLSRGHIGLINKLAIHLLERRCH